MLILMVYLNDDFACETVFPHFGDSIKPKKGSILMFPPMWMYLQKQYHLPLYAKYFLMTYLNYSLVNRDE